MVWGIRALGLSFSALRLLGFGLQSSGFRILWLRACFREAIQGIAFGNNLVSWASDPGGRGRLCGTAKGRSKCILVLQLYYCEFGHGTLKTGLNG